MKAIVYTKYGAPDVLHVAEVEKPAPKNNDVVFDMVAQSYYSACIKVLKPVVDKIYSMDQAVEAHRRVETEQRLGIIVISLRDHQTNETPVQNT